MDKTTSNADFMETEMNAGDAMAFHSEQHSRLNIEADRLHKLKAELDAKGVATVFLSKAISELRREARKHARNSEQLLEQIFDGSLSHDDPQP